MTIWIIIANLVVIVANLWVAGNWLSDLSDEVNELRRVVALHQEAHKSTLALLKEMNKDAP